MTAGNEFARQHHIQNDSVESTGRNCSKRLITTAGEHGTVIVFLRSHSYGLPVASHPQL